MPLTGPPIGPSMIAEVADGSVGAVSWLVWVRHSAAAVVLMTTIRVASDRHADEDDQDGQSGEQQLLHDRSVPRVLMFRLESSEFIGLQPAASMASLV